MVVGILLAAGSSSRFGSPKLLHPLADGTPLGAASARALRDVVGDVVAVIRPGDDALAALLRGAGCLVLENADADAGMGASLACGVRHAADADGWLVALADMPFIRSATIHGVAGALADGARIAAPVLADGRRGHPVGFSREFYPALAELSGDEGARQLVAARSQDFCAVATDDLGCLRDIDRPEDISDQWTRRGEKA